MQVTHFSKCDQFFTVWQIVPNGTFFLQYDPFQQMPHFKYTQFSQRAIFHGVSHFSKCIKIFQCETFFQMSPTSYRVTRFSKCDPVLQCDLFFTFWLIFHSVIDFWLINFSKCDQFFKCHAFFTKWPKFSVSPIFECDPFLKEWRIFLKCVPYFTVCLFFLILRIIFFHMWTIFDSAKHFWNVTQFSKCDLFLQCDPLLKIGPIFHLTYSLNVTHFVTVWPIFRNVTIFSQCGPYRRVWRSFLQADPLFTKCLVFTVWQTI